MPSRETRYAATPFVALLGFQASPTADCVTDVARSCAGADGPLLFVLDGGGGVLDGGGGVLVGGGGVLVGGGGVLVGGGGVLVGGGGVLVGGGVTSHAAVDTISVALAPTVPLLSTPATAYS